MSVELALAPEKMSEADPSGFSIEVVIEVEQVSFERVELHGVTVLSAHGRAKGERAVFSAV